MAPADVKRQTGNRVEAVSPFRRKRRLPTIFETELRALRISQRRAVRVGASA
jgi:prolyl-tRNA editing enzyme YbaK/EbsC (Cys-tRNA(Pro) deacylase)